MTTAELIDHLKDILSAKSDAKLAEMLGMTGRALSMLKLRSGSLAEHVVRLAEREGYDLNLLLLGRELTGKMVAPGTGEDLVIGEELLNRHDLDKDHLLVMQVKTAIPPLKPGDIVVLDTREQHITSSGIYAILTESPTPQLRRVHLTVEGNVQIFGNEHDPVEKYSRKQAEKITTAGRAVLCLSRL